MTRLSVTIITLNEASNIEACIQSVSFADEIVVLDGGSTDGTVDIARRLKANVHVNPEWNGFGTQKNRALDLATGDWVLSLDADERISVDLARQLREAMNRQTESAFEMPRLTQFCGQWIHHCGWTPDFVTRLFRRDSARFSADLVHERLIVTAGSSGRLSAPILHFSYPTPAHYWRKLQQYSDAWALQRHRQGQRASMFRAAGSAATAFVRSYFLRLGFLDGAMGFAVCTMQAQAAFGKYFALYCLNQEDEHQSS